MLHVLHHSANQVLYFKRKWKSISDYSNVDMVHLFYINFMFCLCQLCFFVLKSGAIDKVFSDSGNQRVQYIFILSWLQSERKSKLNANHYAKFITFSVHGPYSKLGCSILYWFRFGHARMKEKPIYEDNIWLPATVLFELSLDVSEAR